MIYAQSGWQFFFALILMIIILILSVLLIRYVIIPLLYNGIFVFFGLSPYFISMYLYLNYDQVVYKWEKLIMLGKILSVILLFGYFLAAGATMYLALFPDKLKDNEIPQLKINHILYVCIIVAIFVHFGWVSEFMYLSKSEIGKIDYLLIGYLMAMVLFNLFLKYIDRISRICKSMSLIPSILILKTRRTYSQYYESKHHFKDTMNKNYHDIESSYEQKNVFEKLAREAKIKWEAANIEAKQAYDRKIKYEFEAEQAQKRKQDNGVSNYEAEKKYEALLSEVKRKLEIAERAYKEAESKRQKSELEVNRAYEKIRQLHKDAFVEYLVKGVMNLNTAIDILGLKEQFTREELRKAFKENIYKNHPDRLGNMSDALRKYAEERTKAINSAYDYLKNRVND